MTRKSLEPSYLRVKLTQQHLAKKKWPITVVLMTSLVLLFTLIAPVAAQNFDAKVSFYVLASEDQPINVGDRVTLRLEVRHPADSEVSLPTLETGELWGDFELVDQTEVETSRRGENVAITHKDIIVTLFEPGQYQTPRLLVTHTNADGSIEELAAPVIQLDVDSILVEGDDELRDIKAQAILPVPPIWPYILLFLLVAMPLAGLVAAGGFWAYHRWQQRAQPPGMPVPVPVDTRPPEVIAYAELDRIEGLHLPRTNRYKEHYSLVTNCLRRYVESRYKIPALERTTPEIRHSFRQAAVSSEHSHRFMNIFKDSDLVKFARFQPDPEEAYQLLNKARSVIRMTTPVIPETTDTPSQAEVEEVIA